MSHSKWSGIWIVVLVTLIVGCSGSGNPSSNPVTNNNPPGTQDTSLTTGNSVPETDTGGWTGHYLWSFQQIWVDPVNLEYEIIPDHSTAGHWNILTWLENGPCTDCFSVVQIVPSGSGTLLIDIQVTHPFESANLTGFDVRGITMFRGSVSYPLLGLTASDRTLGDGELVNPDGYTTLYNITTEGMGPNGLQGYQQGKFEGMLPPDATLNGYKRHSSDEVANTRNAFYAGDSVIQTYEIDMPDGTFIFGYAVDASWAQAINLPVIDPMVDFPPEANCPEPWQITVSDVPIGQGLTDQGGMCELHIRIYDYQGDATNLFPIIEAPMLMDSTIEAPLHLDEEYWDEYVAEIENAMLAEAGEYDIVIRVEDIENETAPEHLDLSAYQITTLTVNEFVPLNPFPCVEVDPNPAIVCEDVTFDGSCSYDPDGGDIVDWSWDFDGDGVYDDGNGEIVTHAYDSPGTYFVDLRVEDEQGEIDTLDTPIEVVVENALPTAIADADKYVAYTDMEIVFDGSASYDTDCEGESIEMYAWDLTGNMEFTDAFTETVPYSYDTPGQYDVRLQVTDDEGETAVSDILQIHVSAAEPTLVMIYDCPPAPIAEDSLELNWELVEPVTPPEDIEVRVKLDDDEWTYLPNGSTSFAFENFDCGGHTATVEALNETDVWGSDWCDFVPEDTEAPNVHINNCPDTPTPSHLFFWDMDDDCTSAGYLIVRIRLDEGDWEELPPGTFELQLDDLECEGKSFEVQVEDEAGLTGSDICYFDGVDVETPYVSFTNCPSDPTGSELIFQWDMGDNCTDQFDLKVETSVNFESWVQETNGCTSRQVLDIACDGNNIRVRVTDGTGLWDEAQCNFDGPDNPPNVAFSNCEEFINKGILSFHWDMDDDCTSLNNLQVLVKLDTGSWQPIPDGSLAYDWLGILPGPHILEVQVVDEGGLAAFDDCVFTYDPDPPAVEIQRPIVNWNEPCIRVDDPDLEYDPPSGTFTYPVLVHAEDHESGLDSVTLEIGPWSETHPVSGPVANEIFYWEFRPNESLPGYKWEFHASAEDTVGNVNDIYVEVFTIFMPGWPSGWPGIPHCGEMFEYWPWGQFYVGEQSGYGCLVETFYPFTARLRENSLQGALARWNYRLTMDDIPDPQMVVNLMLGMRTCCEGDCEDGDWEPMVYDQFAGEWNILPSLGGCEVQVWDLGPGFPWLADDGDAWVIQSGIWVPPGIGNTDGVIVDYVGLWFIRG